ncbi:MAG: NifU family protein [Planctomycetes bacterium]|nr:NifU family protein [Planctomycetota bacterium]
MSWLERLLSGFKEAPERGPAYGDPTRIAEVDGVIEELRPFFRSDGGDVHLIGIENDVVVVELIGACKSCAASAQTLHQALEPRLRARLPWVSGLRRA